MPTYQYTCTDCGEPLEVVQSFSDDALTECPACGGRLRKVFSAVGVVFKGSGFYRNDSRAADGKKAGSTSDSSASDSGSASTSNGDSSTSSSGDSGSAGSSKSSDSSSSSSARSSKKEPASTK